jgi:hypothetical protein
MMSQDTGRNAHGTVPDRQKPSRVFDAVTEEFPRQRQLSMGG